MRVAVLVFAALAALSLSSSRSAFAEQVLREQRTVQVGGARETWQLIWAEKPKSICGPDEVNMAITCPCSGWAYGERGKLSLTRSGGTREIERLNLGPLFDANSYLSAEDQSDRVAYLQRWPPLELGDLERENDGDPHLIAEIERRPNAPIMRFADYDQDGATTEFLLQVNTLPCGKRQFAAVGVSVNNPHLHALTTVVHPETPLVMPLHAWEALLSGPGEHTVRTWECADHGAEVRSEFLLSAHNGMIRVKQRLYSCEGALERVVEETDK
jgi:hypothetical protein